MVTFAYNLSPEQLAHLRCIACFVQAGAGCASATKGFTDNRNSVDHPARQPEGLISAAQTSSPRLAEPLANTAAVAVPPILETLPDIPAPAPPTRPTATDQQVDETDAEADVARGGTTALPKPDTVGCAGCMCPCDRKLQRCSTARPACAGLCRSCWLGKTLRRPTWARLSRCRKTSAQRRAQQAASMPLLHRQPARPGCRWHPQSSTSCRPMCLPHRQKKPHL